MFQIIRNRLIAQFSVVNVLDQGLLCLNLKLGA